MKPLFPTFSQTLFFQQTLYNAEMPLNRHTIWNYVLFDFYRNAPTSLYQQHENSISFVSMKFANTLALQVTSEGHEFVIEGALRSSFMDVNRTRSVHNLAQQQDSLSSRSSTYPGHPGSLRRLHLITLIIQGVS